MEMDECTSHRQIRLMSIKRTISTITMLDGIVLMILVCVVIVLAKDAKRQFSKVKTVVESQESHCCDHECGKLPENGTSNE